MPEIMERITVDHGAGTVAVPVAGVLSHGSRSGDNHKVGPAHLSLG